MANKSLHNINSDDLPGSLHELVELIGLPATLKFVEHWGGLIQVYIPVSITPDHILAQRLGWEAAKALSAVYGGDYIRNVPRCTAAIRTVRDGEIRARHASGESAANLALRYSLTERQIWTILSQSDEDNERQNALF